MFNFVRSGCEVSADLCNPRDRVAPCGLRGFTRFGRKFYWWILRGKTLLLRGTIRNFDRTGRRCMGNRFYLCGNLNL